MKLNSLFNEFPEVSSKAWKQKIQVDLKGKDYNKELVWESPEGIKVKPFYHADDIEKGSCPKGLLPKNWNIGHTIYAGNAIMANERALQFFEKGAEAIEFIIPHEKVKITSLLNNIDVLDKIIYLKMNFLSKDYIFDVLTTIHNAHHIRFQVDTIHQLCKTGNWYQSLEKDEFVFDALCNMDVPHFISIDASLYQNAGANSVQQLAYALAHANEYLNRIDAKGGIHQIKSIQFNISVGGNYFFEIAKIKALRWLWKSLAEAFSTPAECHITAVPSKRNKTIYDYNVNMLRTTTECMAAVLGGANTVFNLPYDSIYRKTNDFSERIALNQLVLLKEESYLNKVSNASEGAYYIETLTQQLAEKALLLFKSIEKRGGFLAQLKSHAIQNKIADSAKQQQDLLGINEEVLVGTNKFIHPEDRMQDNLELFPFVKKNPRKTLIRPIIEKRLAEDMEQKRLKNE